MRIVTGLDIKRWAQEYNSPAEFPALIFKLIDARAPRLGELDFSAGEGVRAGSWDGRVRSRGQHPYVPEGASYWELTVQFTKLRKKLDDDFDKRSGKLPSGVDPKESTYVAVCA